MSFGSPTQNRPAPLGKLLLWLRLAGWLDVLLLPAQSSQFELEARSPTEKMGIFKRLCYFHPLLNKRLGWVVRIWQIRIPRRRKNAAINSNCQHSERGSGSEWGGRPSLLLTRDDRLLVSLEVALFKSRIRVRWLLVESTNATVHLLPLGIPNELERGLLLNAYV